MPTDCQAIKIFWQQFLSRVPRHVESKITQWVRFQYAEELSDAQVHESKSWSIILVVIYTHKRSRRLFLLALRLHILLLTIACLSNLPEEKNSFGSITTPWVSPFSCTISETRPLFPGISVPLIPLLVYYKDGLVSHEFIGVVSRLCGLQDFNPADITATDKK